MLCLLDWLELIGRGRRWVDYGLCVGCGRICEENRILFRDPVGQRLFGCEGWIQKGECMFCLDWE